MKYAMIDFNIGYIGTTLLAVCFLALGANMMYNTGAEFSSQAVSFASELVKLYTSAIGSWSYPIILVAAFFTMFSTTLTCFDAYPRVVSNASRRLFKPLEKIPTEKLYWYWIVIVGVGSILILLFFRTNMKSLVDFATTVSFLNAPVLALIHHLILFGKEIPKEQRPKPWMNLLSWFGILFLFGIFYLLYQYYLSLKYGERKTEFYFSLSFSTFILSPIHTFVSFCLGDPIPASCRIVSGRTSFLFTTRKSKDCLFEISLS